MAAAPSSPHPPDDETVDHLQVAASELLAAARSFLNVVEEVVTDRDRLAGATANITEFLGAAGTSLTQFTDRMAGRAGGGASGGTGDSGTTGGAGGTAFEDGASGKAGASGATRGRPPRVRRIDLDS